MKQTQNSGISLDGKKKFIATMVSIGASLVGLFLAPENVEPATQALAVGGPLVLGFLYDWFQSRHDVKKKEVEAKREDRFMVETQAQAQAAISQPPQLETLNSRLETFDVEAFHAQVLEDTPKRYTEVNPATTFYQAKDKGQVTPCSDITQAMDYWDYLVALAKEADAWLYEMTKQEGPCGKQSPAYYAIHREYQRTVRKRNELDSLEQLRIPWTAKLSPSHQTLYFVGELAEELITTSARR
jgi:hypothetical protein